MTRLIQRDAVHNNILDQMEEAQRRLNRLETYTLTEPGKAWAAPESPYLDVRAFGAGEVTGASIQAAIDYATTTYPMTGMTIFIPSGVHALTTQIRILKDNITIVGNGRGSTVLEFSSALGADAAFYCENTASATAQIYYNSFRDFTVTLADDDSQAFKFERAIEPELVNVQIAGNGTGCTAVIFDGEGDQTGAGGTAWGGGLRMDRCRVSSCKIGVIVRNVAGACHITKSWLVGIYPVAAGSVGIDIPSGTGGNMIIGNLIENWERGIDDDDVGDMYVGNRFENCTSPIYQSATCSRYYSANFMVGSCGAAVYSGYGVALDSGDAAKTHKEIGSPHEDEPDFIVRGAYSSGGPRVSLINNGTSSTLPLIAMKAVGSTDTDDFGQAGPAGQISVEATAPLRIGTGSARNTEIYYNNIKTWLANVYLEGIYSSAQGIILKSPDGTRYLAQIANGGTWTITGL